jgi:2-iminobutanoate/2-iminopropanoate deaminase
MPSPDRLPDAREAVSTPDAPAAIGPYSQAVRHGNLLFVSGQIPVDPITGAVVGEDTAAQTAQVMRNLGAVLAGAGMSFGDVVKATVYMTDLADFAAKNAVYAAHMGTPPPARATVEVSRLPRDVRIEIDIIAAR